MEILEIDFGNEKEKIIFRKNSYQKDGTPAIEVLSANPNETGLPFGVLTVCVENPPKLEENEIIVKTWSENEFFNFLKDTKYFEDTGHRVQTGYVEAEIWKITDESLFASDEEIEAICMLNELK